MDKDRNPGAREAVWPRQFGLGPRTGGSGSGQAATVSRLWVEGGCERFSWISWGQTDRPYPCCQEQNMQAAQRPEEDSWASLSGEGRRWCFSPGGLNADPEAVGSEINPRFPP